MNLLIDFGSIKTGGALQLATNFLEYFREYPPGIDKVFLLLPEKGPLPAKIDRSRYDGCLVYPNNYAARKIFELTVLNKFVAQHSIDHFYTFFGAGLPAPAGVRSVISVAYPIICYPDSIFWKLLPTKIRLTHLFLNHLRCNRIRAAHHVIAETPVMAERLTTYVRIPKERLSVIPPSPSAFIADREYRKREQPDGPNFLLLGGLDRHKNVWRLPEIATELEKAGCGKFRFLISATQAAFMAAYPECRGTEAILDRHFEFLGVIPPQEIQALYDRADFLMNLSDLESFSNNYMEAWKAGLPLICSDTDFARGICRDSAIYVDPHAPASAAAKIVELLGSEEWQRNLTLAGKQLLATLPSLDNKFDRITKIIKGVD